MATIPPALQKGDTIALVSPSSRLNAVFPTRIDRAVSALATLGFKVQVIFTDSLSASFPTAVQQRCEELHAAFRDPAVKAIMCTIGGLAANELLRHLDYALIARNPKILVGYSDITLLHHAIFTQAKLRTFYGSAAITQFGEFPAPLQFTVDHFLHVLMGGADGGGSGSPQGSLVPRSTTWTHEFLDWTTGADGKRAREMEPASSAPYRWLRGGSAKGRLFGGCLPSVLQLVGTAYRVDYSGRVLLLETPEGHAPDAPLPLDVARSNLADLVNCGILDGVVGLVLGRGFRYDAGMRAQWEQIVLDQCHGTGYPILANVDIGHTDPILTLPLDAMVSLDSGKDEFRILEPTVA